MMIIFAFKKAELKEKTQDANFSLPIKNPNPLLKTDSGFGFKNWLKLGGFRIRIANPNNFISSYISSLFEMLRA